MKTSALTIPFAFLSLTLAAGAQQGPRPLPAPDRTYDEPFSSISVNGGGVRELADGRVIVADMRDKMVQLIDLRSGEAQGIGREGSGPGEFGMPLRLFAAPRDTTFLFDPLNTRYLSIAPDGKPVGTFRVELAAPRGGNGPRIGGMSMARATDDRGRLYSESSPLTMGPEGPTSSDTAAILRYDRATQRVDTLGWVRVQKPEISGGAGNMNVRIGGGNPLTPRDEWAVFPDGRVAIVRHDPFRVDWVMPDGTVKQSPAFRHTPIRVTAADRREEEALRAVARQNSLAISVTQDGSGPPQRSVQLGPGANARPLEPLDNYPEFKPPFRAGPASVWARPNGDLWIRRLEPAGAKGALYDVVNPQGAVMYQVRIPENWTLVGFGNGTVYTTSRDEDDLVYLQRHRVPETPIRG
jgi:hypothetical protein